MHVRPDYFVSPIQTPRDEAGDAGHAQVRKKRGGALGKCIGISPFRECRGGEALQRNAVSYVHFDQYDYRRMCTPEGRGTCEGIVREALRRIDRSDGAQPLSLSAAVREMRADANRGGSVATDMFGRVVAFHGNPAALELRSYHQASFVDLSGGATRDQRINRLFTDMRHHLGVRDVAFLRLGVVAPEHGAGGYGHVLAVQRMPQDRYTIFDPNNGAFAYAGTRDMESALREYFDDAFAEAGLEVIPDGIECHTASSLQRDPELKPLEPLLLPADLPESRLARGPDEDSPAWRAYSTTADASNRSSGDVLSTVAGQAGRLAGMRSGLAVYAMADIACGRSADLMSATENLRQALSDATRASATMRAMGDLQERNRYAFVTPIANRLRHEGGSAIHSAADLIDDLRHHFANAYFRDHALRGYRNDFAEIGLTFRGNDRDAGGASGNNHDSDREQADGHSIVVQRLRPSADYEHDEYQIYDSNVGAFRYADFAQMSVALRSLFEAGYGESGGIDHADNTFFADLGSEQAAALPGSVSRAPRESPVACLPLGSVERGLGIGGSPAMTPPHAALPAPPDVDPARLPLYPGHDELKRAPQLAADRKPYALFRPSPVSPETVKARGGFDSEDTKLRDIDLNLHDADLASRPRVTDSAGYLGAFRSERAALGRLPTADARAHFIYSVAPAPNMIDVRASLGSHARAPETGEVAAMGRIDYTQIRGWQRVENGVPGKFVANPDYRWDVYDQTRIAGAQPQLARFPIGSDAWRDGPYRAYVSASDDTDVPRFRRDPNVAHAMFYDNAWQKVRDLQMRQAMGVDYRGPLTLQAYGGSRWRTHLFVDKRGNVLADSAYTRYAGRSGNRHEFRMGDDGRFHLSGDGRSVLRVGSDGYIYLGPVPGDPASLNGVFAYDGRHLIHQEDDKFLTIGKTVYTPFVTTDDCGSRSAWRLEQPNRRRAVPPQANLHTFRGMAEGTRQQLYEFECDPDAALPDNADHFVTRVPDNDYRGDFNAYVDRITIRDARDAARRLDTEHAAWLFRDGYYAVPDGSGGLEVRTLGGTAVWRSADAVVGGKDGMRQRLPARTAASYRIGDDAWRLVLNREDRRARLIAMLAHTYVVG
ncbi:enterotoxin A family protein [Paraburkholderia solisilvae]|uniref:Uncharacterized protein n=1 Tax=Paraburkholderia solisilvae TaxID=624376 RepID=A0A6J5D3T1_9BURK|nr:enterotoxin A family protein [Paraburkholderia solisilvae]CAB3747705.1 hypothetical protein LMG29739_00378 [Paraburkholderia solisilvae]